MRLSVRRSMPRNRQLLQPVLFPASSVRQFPGQRMARVPAPVYSCSVHSARLLKLRTSFRWRAGIPRKKQRNLHAMFRSLSQGDQSAYCHLWIHMTIIVNARGPNRYTMLRQRDHHKPGSIRRKDLHPVFTLHRRMDIDTSSRSYPFPISKHSKSFQREERTDPAS